MMEIGLSMVELRAYQQQALDELMTMPAIGLFFGTGTGKTITSLFRVRQNETKHLLVTCPSKVVSQWESVVAEVMTDYKLVTLSSKWTCAKKNSMLRDHYKVGTHDVIIISVESLDKMPILLDIINEDWTIIVDESHKIKEWGTKNSPIHRTHAALALSKKTEYKIILTATPTQKAKGGYIDYFTQLQFIGYYEGWSQKDFISRYCITEKLQTPGMPYPIQVIKDYKRTDEIETILKATCRRYVASFGDFEPMHEVVDIEKVKSYTTLQKEKYYGSLNLISLSARRIAKKTLCTGIVSGHNEEGLLIRYEDNTKKIDWLREFLEDTDETVIIFYKYNVELEALQKLCKSLKKKFIELNGSTKDKFKEINKPGYEVVLGQFAAAGESVDGLQYRSHICIYYSMPESSLEYKQALGRINRDGQTLVPMYYYPIMKGTIEEEIYNMIQNKIEFSEETLNKLEIKEIQNGKEK